MDLHVHTVLSACAELEMLPPLIVERALELGLAAIAVTDHNSAENVRAVQQAAAGSGLAVIPGMELQTREEVDLLALFETAEAAEALQQVVYATLPDEPNRPEFFGEQVVVDAAGDPVRENTRLLQAAGGLSVEEAAATVARLGGLCIAAHVDRPVHSLIANLGFVPPGLAIDAVEVSRNCDPAAYVAGRRDLRGLAVVSCGDAHRLSEMTARTRLLVAAATFGELRLALRAEGGRRPPLWPG